MSDKIDLDILLQNDSNRKKFHSFLKEKYPQYSVDNLLTLYMLICCFKNQNLTDLTRIKLIFDKTYKTCILKHESELANQLGMEICDRLFRCIKNAEYDSKLFDQVKGEIKKSLEENYLQLFLKVYNKKSSIRTLSSASSLVSQNIKPKTLESNLNKTASSLSLNIMSKASTAKQIENQAVSSDGESAKLKYKRVKYPLKESANNSVKIENSTKQTSTQQNEVQKSTIKTTVAYYMPGESLAYISQFNGNCLTLAQFKKLIIKSGQFRFFFKTKTDLLEEDCVVFQEVTEDKSIVPMFNDKVIAKIEFI